LKNNIIIIKNVDCNSAALSVKKYFFLFKRETMGQIVVTEKIKLE